MRLEPRSHAHARRAARHNLCPLGPGWNYCRMQPRSAQNPSKNQVEFVLEKVSFWCRFGAVFGAIFRHFLLPDRSWTGNFFTDVDFPFPDGTLCFRERFFLKTRPKIAQSRLQEATFSLLNFDLDFGSILAPFCLPKCLPWATLFGTKIDRKIDRKSDRSKSPPKTAPRAPKTAPRLPQDRPKSAPGRVLELFLGLFNNKEQQREVRATKNSKEKQSYSIIV